MKISKIFAGMSAAAIVASMAMIPASAAAYEVRNDTTEEGKTSFGFDLSSPCYGKPGENATGGSGKLISANYALPLSACDTVKKAVINITCTNVNYSYDDDSNPTNAGWANFQFYASGAEWKSGYANTAGDKDYTLKQDETIDIAIDFTPAAINPDDKDGEPTVAAYSIGFEEYGSGSYDVNYISFQDADGKELYKWDGTSDGSENIKDDTSKGDTSSKGDESKKDDSKATSSAAATSTAATSSKAGTTNTAATSSAAASDNTAATGATAGLALAGVALAGAAIVISKRK